MAKKKQLNKKSKILLIIKRVIIWGTISAFAATTLFGSLVLFLFLYGTNDTVTFEEDAVIVLGAAVWGERVSSVLADRLLMAVEYHTHNPNALIVVSGGQGEGAITEAEAMRRFLVAQGVPNEIIIKEDRSTSTLENIKFSKEILDELFGDDYSVAIITNHFHIFRAVSMARRQGMQASGFHAQLRRRYMPWYFTRESAAVGRLWVLGY